MSEDTIGVINYQSEKVPTSLTSTGTIYLQRDTTGSDNLPVGLDFLETTVPIQNARNISPILDTNGFSIVDHTYNHIDYFNEDEIVNIYYEEICNLIKNKTGAYKVFTYDHNIRISTANTEEVKTPQEIKNGNKVQKPAAVVHNDFTVTSAPLRLRQLTEPPKANDTWSKLTGSAQPLIDDSEVQQLLERGGKYVFINAWRNIAIDPVEESHLAICDASTISKNDLITFEIRYVDRTGIY
jgi:hypothetical protein